MLLRNKLKDYSARMAIGMVFLSLGSLGMAVSLILMKFSSQGRGMDFWQGLLMGISLVFLVTSAVLNLSGLITRRKLESGSPAP